MSAGRAPLALPLRVLVKGASTVGWLGVMSGPPSDLGFPRAIEAGLAGLGRPASVQAVTLASERTKSALLNWEREAVGFSPDVVVLVYGHYETLHLFLPWWFERHSNSNRIRHRRVTDVYRRQVLRKVWMFAAKLQAAIDSRVDPTLRRGRPRRVAQDVTTLIENVRQLGSPLVYVFELLEPGSRYRTWFPGMTRRIAAMNEALEGAVVAIDRPDVRYFRVSDLVATVAAGDLDVAQPDGFHYSPALHRAVGERLAVEIDAWADEQAHLTPPG